MTKSKFNVDGGSLWGRGVLLGERVVTEREFTVDWRGFRGGIVAKRSEAKRSEAKRSEAKRSECLIYLV